MNLARATGCPDYARPSLDKRLNGRRRRFVKSATIRVRSLFPMHIPWQKRPENAAFSRPTGLRALKRDFTIRAVGPRFRDGLVILDGSSSTSAVLLDLLTGPNHLYIGTNEPAALCRPPARCRLRQIAGSGPADRKPRLGGHHATRTDPRSRSSRPHGAVDTEAGREPEIFRRRDGHDRQRAKGRVGLFARLGRLRALFAQTDGVEDVRHGAHGVARAQPAGAGAPRRSAEGVRL